MPTFINEVELSLSTTGSYETVSLASYVPTNAAVVFLKLYNPNGYSYTIICRSGDSSQTLTTEGGHGGCFRDYTGAPQAVKLGTGRTIAVKRTVSNGRVTLYGYLTTDEIAAVDDMSYVTLGVAATWTLTDLTSYLSTYGVNGKAYGVLIQSMVVPDSGPGLQARPTGATTSFLSANSSQAYNGLIACQLDINNKLELYSTSASSTQRFYIVGFLKKDILVNSMTDGVDITPTATSTFVNTSGFPSNATAVILSVVRVGGGSAGYGAIPKTSPTSVLSSMGCYSGFNLGCVPIGADQSIQLYRSNTNLHFYQTGYWKLPSENQLFYGVNT